MTFSQMQLFVFILIGSLGTCGAYSPGFSVMSITKLKPDIYTLVPLLKIMKIPPEEERDVEVLREKLGEHYDPYFTMEPDSNIAKEPANPNEENDIISHPEMNDGLRHMKFYKVKQNGEVREYGRGFSHRIQKWLWNLSQCPVRYQWIDLGLNVFPRFIKRGECMKKKTCSYPAGMKCEKKSWKEVTVLLYTCIKDGNNISPECKWRFLKLSVLTECQCGCNRNNLK